MRFAMPNFPCDFDVPDDWLFEAGLQSFSPSAMGYRSWPEAQLVPLLEILPPPRNSATPKDWRGEVGIGP
jgi:hypothetical protein